MSSNHSKTRSITFLWILVFLYALVTFIFPFLSIPTFLYASIVVLLGTLFAIIHGSLRYGGKGMLLFIISCLVIGNLMENLSIITSFPFGHYHYSDALGPKLFAVPLIIGPAYFSTGYLSFVIANVLLDKIDNKLNKYSMFAHPVIASFIMVMWDLVMDPTNSTILHNWVWTDGGGYFGVPLSNYLGWFLTVYLFFQSFSLYLWKRKNKVMHDFPKSYWYQAILSYLIIGLSFITFYLIGAKGGVTDAAGFVWQQHFIRESSVIVSLFTMCFISVLALIRIANPEMGSKS